MMRHVSAVALSVLVALGSLSNFHQESTLVAPFAEACTASPAPYMVTQPDGSKQLIYLRGSNKYARMEF